MRVVRASFRETPELRKFRRNTVFDALLAKALKGEEVVHLLANDFVGQQWS